MKRFVISLLGLCLIALPQLHAETIEKTGRFGGMNISYKIVLPNGYDPARAYPAVLAFGGGSQTMDVVNRSLDNNYRAEAERRGYIVVMPAAANGRLFTTGAGVIFPQFLEQIFKDYKIENRKFHVAGASNGGNSALFVAARYPQYFLSVTGFPGYLEDIDELALENLRPLCLYLHVGELDSEWRDAMTRQAEFLRANGMHVQFTIEPGQPHGIQTLARAGAKRLFDQFEESLKGCR